MSQDIQIHNCHTHLFTLDHMPKKAFGWLYYIRGVLKNQLARMILHFFLWCIGRILRKTADDLNVKLQRLEAFLDIGEEPSQINIFEKSLRHYYPEKTRFVVLSMDFSGMGYGDPETSIEQQLEQLASIRDKYPDQILPFVHIDPRKPTALEDIKKWIIDKRFMGVKIYPPFGYSPTDDCLSPIYEFCEQHGNGIPVMTHCSVAALRSKRYKNAIGMANELCAPKEYRQILDKYPNLRLCLGHCGGNRAWEAFLDKPLEYDRQSSMELWLNDILDMLRSEKYTNLFVDIAYVIFHFHENVNILKVLMEDENIRRKVLFGTDFYMVEFTKFSEKQLSMFLRGAIGRDYFREIAETNPQRYLYGTNYNHGLA